MMKYFLMKYLKKNDRVSLYVLSVGEISVKNMDFTFDMYFRQFWVDQRLQFNPKEVRVEKHKYYVKMVLFRPELTSWLLVRIISS